MLTTNIGSNSSGLSNLTQIGIGFQKDGTLAVDSAKLNAALSTNYQGVANLFVAAGICNRQPGELYLGQQQHQSRNVCINITQLATQGTAVGSTGSRTDHHQRQQ